MIKMIENTKKNLVWSPLPWSGLVPKTLVRSSHSSAQNIAIHGSLKEIKTILGNFADKPYENKASTEN